MAGVKSNGVEGAAEYVGIQDGILKTLDGFTALNTELKYSQHLF